MAPKNKGGGTREGNKKKKKQPQKNERGKKVKTCSKLPKENRPINNHFGEKKCESALTKGRPLKRTLRKPDKGGKGEKKKPAKTQEKKKKGKRERLESIGQEEIQ